MKFEIQKKTNRKPWYIIHGKKYSYHIILLPIVPFVVLFDKIHDYNYKKMVWDEAKATKVLNKALPKVLDYFEEEKAFYYGMHWGTYGLHHNAPIGYKKWAKKFAFHLQKFIENGYENPDYIKTVEEDEYCDTWVKFEERGE